MRAVSGRGSLCRIDGRTVTCGGANCCAGGRSAVGDGSDRRIRRWRMRSRTGRYRCNAGPSGHPRVHATGRTRDYCGEMAPLPRRKSWKRWCSRGRRQRDFLCVCCCAAIRWSNGVSCDVGKEKGDSSMERTVLIGVMRPALRPRFPNQHGGAGGVSACGCGRAERKETPGHKNPGDRRGEYADLRHW